MQVKFKTRLNASIYQLNFLSDVTKRKRAKALFALLFASLAILRLVYALWTNKIPNSKVVGLFAVEKETKYVGYYHCYRQQNNMHFAKVAYTIIYASYITFISLLLSSKVYCLKKFD